MAQTWLAEAVGTLVWLAGLEVDKVPCLTVSTLENRLVMCRKTWCYKLQNLNVTEGDRKWSQGLPFLGQPCSWQCIKKTTKESLCCCITAREEKTRAGKAHGEEPSEVPPATSWQLCHKVEPGSNQTISVCLQKNPNLKIDEEFQGIPLAFAHPDWRGRKPEVPVVKRRYDKM